MDISEDEDNTHEEVTREESPRRDTKTPSRLVQKNHLEDQITEVSPRRDMNTPSGITQKNHSEGLIIGNKSTGVQKRRQLLYQT